MAKLHEPTIDPPERVQGYRTPQDALLDGVRRGDAAAFARFYELHRDAVYSLVSHLLRGHGDACATTREVFVGAYREVLLGDPDVDVVTTLRRLAVVACRERRASKDATEDDRAAASPPLGADRSVVVAPDDDLDDRVRRALRALSDEQYEILVLDDVLRLRVAETATVLGSSAAAATALLFHAGEAFRATFARQTSRQAAACRLAEQAAIGAVGRRLPADGLRTLRAHARYCRDCRGVMKGWGPGPAGLGLFLRGASPPDELDEIPVFGGRLSEMDGRGAGRAFRLSARAAATRTLAVLGAALASRRVAYAVAAACFAGFVGMALYVSQQGGARYVTLTVRTAPRSPGGPLNTEPTAAGRRAATPTPQPQPTISQRPAIGPISEGVTARATGDGTTSPTGVRTVALVRPAASSGDTGAARGEAAPSAVGTSGATGSTPGGLVWFGDGRTSIGAAGRGTHSDLGSPWRLAHWGERTGAASRPDHASRAHASWTRHGAIAGATHRHTRAGQRATRSHGAGRYESVHRSQRHASRHADRGRSSGRQGSSRHSARHSTRQGSSRHSAQHSTWHGSGWNGTRHDGYRGSGDHGHGGGHHHHHHDRGDHDH